MTEFIEALTIAGHDSDGSAGMPADLHAFYARGVYGMGVLTAAVAGNSKGIFSQQVMPLDFIEAQFKALHDDFKVKACKTGMLANKDVIRLVAENLTDQRFGAVVLDPVIITKHGATLLDDDAYQTFLQTLLPLATIVTPNFYEAQKLTGLSLQTPHERLEGARYLQRLGAKNVLLKGRHDRSDQKEVSDFLLLEDGSTYTLSKPYFATSRVNGTGDTLSAVITAELAKGRDVLSSVKIAKDFTYEAICHPIQVGTKFGPINHAAAQKRIN